MLTDVPTASPITALLSYISQSNLFSFKPNGVIFLATHGALSDQRRDNVSTWVPTPHKHCVWAVTASPALTPPRGAICRTAHRVLSNAQSYLCALRLQFLG